MISFLAHNHISLTNLQKARRQATRDAFLKRARRKEKLDARKQEKVETVLTPNTLLSDQRSIATPVYAFVASGAGSHDDPDPLSTSIVPSLLKSKFTPNEGVILPTPLAPSIPRILTSASKQKSQSVLNELYQISSSEPDESTIIQISLAQSSSMQSLQDNPLLDNNSALNVDNLIHPIPGTHISPHTQISNVCRTIHTAAETAPTSVRIPNPILNSIPTQTEVIIPPKKETKLPSNLQKGAIHKDGIVDMYTYHRGREGCESRDMETGELLCDVGPTDTSFGWDQKRLSTSVTISFPIGDDDEDFHFFKEVVDWDLTDPRTPTAMAFAVNVAHEYGLNFGQTMDVASDIQSQLDEYITNLPIYATPLTVKDPNDKERGKAQSSAARPRQLYGVPISIVAGGLPLPGKQKQKVLPAIRAQTLVNPFKVPSSRPLILDDDEFSFRSIPELRTEVKRRAQLASKVEIEARSKANGDHECGILEEKANAICHICHTRKPSNALFACGNPVHAYCEAHCVDRLGFSIAKPESRPVLLDYCPICCLVCECTKCRRRLDSVAVELKKRCVSQGGVRLEDTEFDDVLQYTSTRVGGSSKKAAIVRVNKIGGFRVNHEIVKIRGSDFPREMCGTMDLEPGCINDYKTVYTDEGALLSEESSIRFEKTIEAEEHETDLQEDGSVDYCLICRRPGDLLCCDRCPRAYHTACIGESDDPPDGRWECHECLKEREGLGDDLVDGKSYFHKNGHTSIDKITSSLVQFSNSVGFIESHLILSMIHEMLSKLIDYEFGYIFRAPVDCTFVPNYKTIVKKPMDLGTIYSRIENGYYAKKYLITNNTCDDVIAAVLEDIELVWHNCFTFNVEGSAVYRMAEVHRRRYLSIRRRSFDHLLSDVVKERVIRFVESCENERVVIATLPKRKSSASLARFSVPSAHKIDVKVSYGGNRRDVAILDPKTGLLVKIYSTQRSACIAANFLKKQGHKPEFEPLSDHLVKNYIRSSAHNPSQLLFGHRWLIFDDLKAGTVAFGEKSNDGKSQLQEEKLYKKTSPEGFVEMKDGNSFFIFLSIEEALCFNGLPKDVPIHQIRSRFCELPFDEWTAVVGFKWRKVSPASRNRVHDANIDDTTDYGHLIVKKDSITGRKLLGFYSLAAAHKDWLSTCSTSPLFNQPPCTTLEEFSSKFLDNDGHVDGIVWKSMKTVQFLTWPMNRNKVQANTTLNGGREITKNKVDGVNCVKSPISALDGQSLMVVCVEKKTTVAANNSVYTKCIVAPPVSSHEFPNVAQKIVKNGGDSRYPSEEKCDDAEKEKYVLCSAEHVRRESPTQNVLKRPLEIDKNYHSFSSSKKMSKVVASGLSTID